MVPIQESNSARPWTDDSPPRRILVIRFHAVGDVAITLPWCVSLRRHFPDAGIDFLTGPEARELPESLELFNSVLEFEVTGSRWRRFLLAITLGLRLALRRYDLVLDLQRNWISRILRLLSVPKAWSEFERYAPRAAGERVEEAFRRAGFVNIEATLSLPIKSSLLERGRSVLRSHGWSGSEKLIVVNPAGLWGSRNWPLESYVEFCRIWLDKEPVRFVVLGTERIRRKAELLQEALGYPVLNIAGETSLGEAMVILQFCAFVLSEDSGLMHMAWTSGIPTLALFGSSRSDWSRPLGPKSLCLHSGDLPCGACMDAVCRFGDVHCLTRFSPRMVFDLAQSIADEDAAGVAA